MSGMGSSYFSVGQWQELELQALIFRHMLAGAAIPTELLHLLNKTLMASSSSSSSPSPPPYYLCSNQYYPHYQTPLMQTGYWGKAVMDPEPGRCRRTDGKKWRCSRDVVAGQKYCERHMHRGRNRSRKPVEVPAATSSAGAGAGAIPGAGGGGGDAIRSGSNNNYYASSRGMDSGVGGKVPHFSLSGTLPSMDLLQLNRRPPDSMIETKRQFESQNDDQINSGRTLRCFFDDWPRSLHNAEVAATMAPSSTNLTISMPENTSSDVSLKLGTGDGDDYRARVASSGPSWAWESNRAGPMGGPLAEALRSSMSTTSSSPTSVLHRLARSAAASEASYVSS